MKTQCKSCSAQLSIPPKFIGRKILCPKCNTRVETAALKPLAECEHCWSEYRVKFDLMGKRLMCPGCKKITKIVPKSPRIEMSCYACAEKLSVPQRMLGWTVRCKKCNSENKVLEAKEAAFLRRDLENEFLVVEDLRDLAEGTPMIAKADDPVSPQMPDGKRNKTKGDQVIRTQSMMSPRSQFVPKPDDSRSAQPAKSDPADAKHLISASDQEHSDSGSFVTTSLTDSSSAIDLHIDGADLPYVIVKSTYVPDTPNPSVPTRDLGAEDTGEISSSANFEDSDIGLSESKKSPLGDEQQDSNASPPEIRVRIVKSNENSSDIEVDQTIEGPPSVEKSSASSRWAIDETVTEYPESAAATVANRNPASSTDGSSIASARVTSSQSSASQLEVGMNSPPTAQPAKALPENAPAHSSKSGFKKRRTSKFGNLLVYCVASIIALAFAISIGWLMYVYLTSSQAERPQPNVSPERVDQPGSDWRP